MVLSVTYWAIRHNLRCRVNKGLASITPQEFNEIRQKWFQVKSVHKIDWQYLWKWIVGTIIIILIFFVKNQKLSIEIKKRKKAEAELEKAIIKAEKASSVKSQFLANMSHEIRTPLNSILGFADLLELNELDSVKKEQLHSILNSGRLLRNIINDILDFSKIEAGKLDINIEPFSFKEVMQNCENIFYARAKEKNVDFIIDYSTDIPEMVEGDEVRIRQILMNIYSNAVKFTEKGYIKTELTYNEEQMKITVTDTGIGMTAEQVDRLFNAFEQAESSTTRKFGGTGLGMAITDKLAALMNGSFSVKSEYGKGTSFIIILPLKSVEKIENEQTVNKKYAELLQNWKHHFRDDFDLQEILIEAVKRLPEDIKKLEACINMGDKEKIRLEAHRIKGMTGNFQMHPLFELIKDIEHSAKNEGNLDQINS